VIGLFASEWLRFRSRKLIRWLAILAVAGIVVGAVLAAIGSHKPTPENLAQAQRRVDRLVMRCTENKNGNFFEEPLPSGVTAEEFCGDQFQATDFVSGDQLALGELPEYMQGAGFIVMLIGLVSGASAVGASWQSGTITTILTWEPRRIRWLLIRLAVVSAGVFLLTIALLFVFSLAIAAGAALRGSTSMDPGWMGDVVKTALRISGVTVAVALLGASVATIGRNTAAALGAVFVYMAVFESVVRGFRPALGRFMLGDSIATVVTATKLEVFQGDRVFVVTPPHGAFVILAYVVLLATVAAVALRARDIQ
jgi:ABC-2 type transport system permease protein